MNVARARGCTFLTPREASVFACIADAVVAPVPPLPAIAQTDAIVAFDRQLAALPALSRAGLRAAVLALELAPLADGAQRARLRRVAGREPRLAALRRAARRRALAPAFEAIRAVAHYSYYGDDGVMRTLGYDAQAVLDRAGPARARLRALTEALR